MDYYNYILCVTRIYMLNREFVRENRKKVASAKNLGKYTLTVKKL